MTSPTDLLAAPLAYQASFENHEDETETIRQLTDTLLQISKVTSADSGHASRSVHAKGHGLLKGTLKTCAPASTFFRQGLFAEEREFPATIRLSTTPGDILDDHISTPRGLALRISGVGGERLPDSNDAIQDFLFVNGAAFLASDAKHFLSSLKLLAATTDKAEPLKRAISALFRGAEKALEAVGHPSGTLKGLGGHPLTNILGETFYTQTPYLYGPYMAKFSLAPSSANLRALKDKAVELKGKPNGLREEVVGFFAANSAEWELRAQLCTSLDSMPVEDASVVWPETESAFVTIATLHVPMQDAWASAGAAALEDRLAFNPWYGLAAHRPLGSVNRARRTAYVASAEFRTQFNRCPMNHE